MAKTTFGWPTCSRCRNEALLHWNGREPGASHRGMPLVPARYWVRVRGTTGLMRHLCAKCVKETGDTVEANLGRPPRAA